MSLASSAKALEVTGEAAFVEFIRRTRLGVALSIGLFIGVSAAIIFSVNTQNSSFSSTDGLIIYAGITLAVSVAVALAGIQGSLFRSMLTGGKTQFEMVRICVVGLVVVFALLTVPRLILNIPILNWVTLKSIYGFPLNLATGVWMTFVAPMSEEVVFRCWLQTRLTAVIGKFSVPITVLVFSAFHGGGYASVAVLPLAIVLSVIRYKSKALLPGLVLHIIYNTGIFVSLMFLIGYKS